MSREPDWPTCAGCGEVGGVHLCEACGDVLVRFARTEVAWRWVLRAARALARRETSGATLALMELARGVRRGGFGGDDPLAERAALYGRGEVLAVERCYYCSARALTAAPWRCRCFAPGVYP